MAEGGPSAILFGLCCLNRCSKGLLRIVIKCPPTLTLLRLAALRTSGCIPNSERGVHGKDIDRKSNLDTRRRGDDRSPWLGRARSGGWDITDGYTVAITIPITLAVTIALTITHAGADWRSDRFAVPLGQRCPATGRGTADRRTAR